MWGGGEGGLIEREYLARTPEDRYVQCQGHHWWLVESRLVGVKSGFVHKFWEIFQSEMKKLILVKLSLREVRLMS